MLTWIKAYLFYISCQMKFFPFYSQTQFCVVVFFISYISVLLPLQCTERETLPWLRSYSVRIAVFVYLRLCTWLKRLELSNKVSPNRAWHSWMMIFFFFSKNANATDVFNSHVMFSEAQIIWLLQIFVLSEFVPFYLNLTTHKNIINNMTI